MTSINDRRKSTNDKLDDLLERIVKNEEAVAKQTEVFLECIKQNNQAHADIMLAVNAEEKWRNKVQWTLGTVLLMLGMVIGFISTHIEWFWNVLPMHRHVH